MSILYHRSADTIRLSHLSIHLRRCLKSSRWRVLFLPAHFWSFSVPYPFYSTLVARTQSCACGPCECRNSSIASSNPSSTSPGQVPMRDRTSVKGLTFCAWASSWMMRGSSWAFKFSMISQPLGVGLKAALYSAACRPGRNALVAMPSKTSSRVNV